MEISTVLPIPPNVLAYVQDCYARAWEERQELGLAMPRRQPSVVVSVHTIRVAHHDLKDNKIYVNIFCPDLTMDESADCSDLVGFAASLLATNSPMSIDDLCGVFAGREPQHIRVDKKWQTYFDSGTYQHNFESFMKYLSTFNFANDSDFFGLRHELDHSSFLAGPLGMQDCQLRLRMDEIAEQLRQEGKDSRLMYTTMPDEDLQLLFRLDMVMEIGGYFFDVVPIGQWARFRKHPTRHVRELLDNMVAFKDKIIPMHFGVYEDLTLQIARQAARAYAAAYRHDPSRLKTAYESATTLVEFFAIVKGKK